MTIFWRERHDLIERYRRQSFQAAAFNYFRNEQGASAYVPSVQSVAKQLKNKRYYDERAAYMRQLAEEAQTEALRKSCLKAAEAYEILASNAGKGEPDASDKE